AGGTILAIITALAFLAPLFAGDAITMQPALRLRPPSENNWFGTDHLGRDVFARTVYGAQVSLFVGISVAAMSITGGLFIGLMSGYFRKVDAIVMRLMDGLMAIPAILIEAALSFLGAGTPPEIPTWGNMIAQSRLFLSRAPWTIFCPGIALALVVLGVNLLGDGLRDRLDPRLARRM